MAMETVMEMEMANDQKILDKGNGNMKLTIASEHGMDLMEAARAEQTAKALKARANLRVLLNKPVGIGEHTDLVAEVLQFVEQIADAEDNLEVINSLLGDINNPKLLSD
jgi:hypothetical protein